MLDLVLVACAAYLYVALRAAQQLNVAHGHYRRVPVVSAGLALAEVAVVYHAARRGLVVAVPLWVGGTLGCWSSMLLYRYLSRAHDQAQGQG